MCTSARCCVEHLWRWAQAETVWFFWLPRPTEHVSYRHTFDTKCRWMKRLQEGLASFVIRPEKRSGGCRKAPQHCSVYISQSLTTQTRLNINFINLARLEQSKKKKKRFCLPFKVGDPVCPNFMHSRSSRPHWSIKTISYGCFCSSFVCVRRRGHDFPFLRPGMRPWTSTVFTRKNEVIVKWRPGSWAWVQTWKASKCVDDTKNEEHPI